MQSGKILEKSRSPEEWECEGGNLPAAAEKFLKSAGRTYEDVDILSVIRGPGSFTSLKILMTFAKGFRACLPNRPVIANDLFEILTHNQECDAALLELGGNSVYAFDGQKYFLVNRDAPGDIFGKGKKIITNSLFLLDLLKNNCRMVLGSFSDENIADINCDKAKRGAFGVELSPLYIREPDVNLKKNE
ncbi:MAG: hypothetical protein LBB09_03580 [Rickettsiales bacterium]|jgi:tRNA A37 threonylcarbamoyladenosine modification protein TsaB|nr:hypothetical protein [Rickettsiales bacterium]